jgi:PAS domain S-box-containing protein
MGQLPSAALDELLERMPAVFAVLRGPDHVIEYANPLFAELVAGEAVVGRPVREVFGRAENRAFLELLDRVRATGEPQSGEEWRGVFGEGLTRWFDFAFVPLESGEGVLIHAVDVTRRVEARRHAEETERRFRLLVDANVVGVTVSDGERVLEANDEWLEIVGRDRAELEAERLSWAPMTAPEYHAADERAIEALLTAGRVEPYEKEYVRPDGTRVPVLVGGALLDRSPLRVVALVIDLRERRQLLAAEREARRLAELAADRTARLQRVTAALSAATTAEQVGLVVVEQALAALGATAGALAFRDGDDVELRHDQGFAEAAMAEWRRFPLALPSPLGEAIVTGEPVLLERLAAWDRYPELRGRITGRFSALAALPLSVAGGVAGALVLCDEHERRFDDTDRAFLSALADQAAQALERARLYEERAYVAHTLQEGLLPERLTEIPGIGVAVRYHSIADGGAVGCDFYDCFDISRDSWLVAVGDVAGKGTAAAVLTGLARHTLRAIALREKHPDAMLRFLNEALRRQSTEAAFCTVGCARLERTAGGGFRALLASGGHPYPLLVRAGGDVEEVVVRGTLLGVDSRPQLELVPLELHTGDTLVLYTDGAVDARNADGERFGEERLRAALAAAAHDSADGVAAALDQAVARFEPERRRDDRAIVAMHVTA